MCDFHTADFDSMSTKDRYFLMTGCILPRPIAWVTSYNRDKSVLNLAPFSYFNGVSTKPALIMLGVGRKKDGDEFVNKDTSRNILDNNEFVVHIPQVDQADSVEKSAQALPENESEVEACELETIPSEKISVPRLKDAAIQMECRLYQAIQLPPSNGQMILGEVLLIHVNKEYWKDGRVDGEKINPLARLGAGQYAELGKRFEVN